MANRKFLLKLTLFTWAVLPLVDLGLLISRESLGANPQEFIQRYLGTCALVLLLVTYSISLIARVTTSDLVGCRRMVGLFSFLYMTFHFLSYLAFEQNFLIIDFFEDFLKRPFVFLGTIAFLITIPLAITSNNRSMKFLGTWWKRLHSVIVLIIVLSLAHFFLHKAGKNDFFWPLIASAVFGTVVIVKKSRYFKTKSK